MKVKDRWNEPCSRCGQSMHNLGRTWIDESRVCPSCWLGLVETIEKMQEFVNRLNLEALRNVETKQVCMLYRDKRVFLRHGEERIA